MKICRGGFSKPSKSVTRQLTCYSWEAMPRPRRGTLDPEILLYCEAEHRMLVTDNRKSMPSHEADHFAAGQHHWGILTTSRHVPIGELALQLRMFWEASEAEEWRNRAIYIPF